MDEARQHMKSAHETMRKVAEAWVPEGVRENQKAAPQGIFTGAAQSARPQRSTKAKSDPD